LAVSLAVSLIINSPSPLLFLIFIIKIRIKRRGEERRGAPLLLREERVTL
jgi:hypothetical protein